MAVHKTLDVMCDICSAWKNSNGASTSIAARKFVTKYCKWKTVKEKGKLKDLCPVCAGNVKELWEARLNNEIE